MHGLGVDQTLITQSCALPHVVGHVGGVHACVITHVDASGHGAQPLEAADTMYRVAVCIPCVVLPAMLHEGMHGPKPLHGLITHTQGVVGASVVGACVYVVGDCVYVVGDWVVGDCVYDVGDCVYDVGDCVYVVGDCVYVVGDWVVGDCVYDVGDCVYVVGDCVYVGIGVYVEGVVGACVYTGVVGHVGGP